MGRIRGALTRIMVVAVVVLSGIAPATRAADIGVSGDDDRDAFLSSGSLLLDDTFTGDDATRRAVATCPGCRWRTVPTCVSEDTSCLPGLSGCPAGTVRATIWLSRPGEPLEAIGRTCVGPGGPRTVESVSAQVREAVLTRVPPLRPTISPTPAIRGLAVLARSGQPPTLGARTLDILGAEVILDAAVTWTWRWGDGGVTSTTAPSVRHSFRQAGVLPVQVTAAWQAWFTVDDLGPFAASGERVTQEQFVTVTVRRARAVLLRP